MADVIMPQMGESIAEGTVTKWLKNVGDRVERDEPLFEISTDKVDAEIPSPAAGVLKEIRVAPGTTVAIHTVVAVIAPEVEAVAPVPPAPVPPAPVPPPPAPVAGPEPAVPPVQYRLDDEPPATPPAPEKPRAEMNAEELRLTRSSPVVRKIAAEHQVDIREVPGTGIGGRVTKHDILGHIEGHAAVAPAAEPALGQANGSSGTQAPADTPTAEQFEPPPVAPGPVEPPPVEPPPVEPPPVAPPPVEPPPVAPALLAAAPVAAAPAVTIPLVAEPIAATPTASASSPTPAPAAAPAPQPAEAVATPPPAPRARIEVVPMSPIRRRTAEHMVLSKRTSAHVSTVFEIDMTRVHHLREKHRAAFEERGVKLTYIAFILKAVVDALKAFPVLNASIDGDNVVYRREINLGVAVALDWGLIVPVIHAADEKNVLGLARAVSDLAARARSKKLKVEEVQGGSFTITNPGVFGSLFGTPIINQPQVAILDVGTIEKRPVVRDDAIAIRTMAYFALTFDHRLVDGSDADRFMAHVKQTLQEFDEAAL